MYTTRVYLPFTFLRNLRHESKASSLYNCCIHYNFIVRYWWLKVLKPHLRLCTHTRPNPHKFNFIFAVSSNVIQMFVILIECINDPVKNVFKLKSWTYHSPIRRVSADRGTRSSVPVGVGVIVVAHDVYPVTYSTQRSHVVAWTSEAVWFHQWETTTMHRWQQCKDHNNVMMTTMQLATMTDK